MTLVTIFGGTGFLGRHIVETLSHQGVSVRVAARNLKYATANAAHENSGRITSIAADVRDRKSVAAAIEGVDGVVNAVSTYVEKGSATYTAVHVAGAANVANACKVQGVSRFVHISGIGADPNSNSPYIRARGQGELVVQQHFPQATILRPSVMFASDDAFLNMLARMIRFTPVIPLMGGGRTRLQPIHVSDVAGAVSIALRNPATVGQTYELGGPETYTLRAIIELILAHTGRHRLFIPIPFTLAHPLASVLQLLPRAPLTVAQVDLLREDNIPAAHALGTRELGLTPQKVEDAIPRLTSLEPPKPS